MKIIRLVIIMLFAMEIIACQPTKKAKDDSIDSDLVKNPATADSKDTSRKLPIFKFYEESFDFGRIREGQKVHHTFKFKNVGNSDLIISNAHGSCGCTIPTYSEKPVLPNEEGAIEVSFNSTGKEGVNRKTVTIYANTIPNTHVLTISGEVKPEKENK